MFLGRKKLCEGDFGRGHLSQISTPKSPITGRVRLGEIGTIYAPYYPRMYRWGLHGVGGILLAAILSAQTTEQNLSQIERGLRKGEVALILPYLHDPVEIAIGGKAKMYSRIQAEYVLKDFFKSHPPKGFTFMHRGRSENVLYAIGTYHAQGEQWDVSIFGRVERGRYQVEQLRFEAVE